MERVRSDADFRDFVVPLEKLDRICDATFFVRSDGLLAFSEGYFHPEGKLVGNMIYVPDEKGTKKIFGVPYGSLIKKRGSGHEEEWIEFEGQIGTFRSIDPSTQEGKPLFAEYKCLFQLDDFVGFVDPRRSLKMVRERSAEVDRAIVGIARELGVEAGRIGCTGSLALGNLGQVHDFDLIFYGTLEENRRVIERIYEIVREPKRQVFEYGMLWAIRFYDGAGNMVCPFFSYEREEEIPLTRFDSEILSPESEIEARVADDAHACYMPSVLGLEEVRFTKGECPGLEALILYHGGLRGEFRKGDRLWSRGRAVRVQTPERDFVSLLATNLSDSKKI